MREVCAVILLLPPDLRCLLGIGALVLFDCACSHAGTGSWAMEAAAANAALRDAHRLT